MNEAILETLLADVLLRVVVERMSSRAIISTAEYLGMCFLDIVLGARNHAFFMDKISTLLQGFFVFLVKALSGSGKHSKLSSRATNEPADVEVWRPSAAVVTGWFRVVRPCPASTIHGPREEKSSTDEGSGSAKAPKSPLALVCRRGDQV